MAREASAGIKSPPSAHRGQEVLRDEHALRREHDTVAVVAACEADYQIQLGDAHEDLAAIAAREECPHRATLIRILDRVPEIAPVLRRAEIAQGCGRLAGPFAADDLLSLPATVIHHE